MARPGPERTIQRPVLDRLLDADPDSATEPTMTRAQSVRELKRAVRRDLEWLLNTRRVAEPAPEGLVEVHQSLYDYGLPDVTSASADSTDTRNWLRRQLEETIVRFEPRLAAVRVTVAAPADTGRRDVRFVVEALLRLEPTPEQVVFDTVLEIPTTSFAVSGDIDA